MSDSIVLKRCAACRADKPVSEMKVCMHQQMHNYVCDSKCMHDFYNPPPAENQHARDSAELRDLCSQRDGFKAELWRAKEERDSQQRIAIAAMAELAELKAKSSGVDERAAFEAAYLKANYPRVAAGELSAPPIFGRVGSMRFHGQAEGDYECSDVHKCWVIWQASAAMPLLRSIGTKECMAFLAEPPISALEITTELAELKAKMVPIGCRQRLASEGKPYPRSSCAVCGQLSPRWRECDSMLAAAPSKEGI